MMSMLVSSFDTFLADTFSANEEREACTVSLMLLIAQRLLFD